MTLHTTSTSGDVETMKIAPIDEGGKCSPGVSTGAGSLFQLDPCEIDLLTEAIACSVEIRRFEFIGSGNPDCRTADWCIEAPWPIEQD